MFARVSSPEVADLATRQVGVATRQQLRVAGCSQTLIRSQVAAHRWTEWGSHVVILHNFQPSRHQLMWAAVLDAGWPAALASHTSLELAGFRPFAVEAIPVHLIVPRGAKVQPNPHVVIHESRRVRPEFHVVGQGPPRTPIARSAVDAASWQPWPRFACTLLAAVAQQRLCTADDLDRALRQVGRVRHKRHLRDTVLEISAGSAAISEIDLVKACARHGIVRPHQQVRRNDVDGKPRYLDASWRLPDGRTVVLEVDGRHHLDIAQWQDDVRRERAVVIGGAQVLRATAIELRTDQERVIADLRAIGVPSCQN
ncbi:hypothetical protein [Microlunatus speluncae]|uniref:hypothetical protein n=1 Tax=Microlunatus speluncae TaxID=2594267 RepID=UPI0012663D1E|nr:hypothetical protein [Microlunatus speluncae]